MLEIKIGLLVKNNLSELYVTDETGVYSLNNEEGYGTPNIDRGEYALTLLARRINYEKEASIISLDTAYVDYDPNYPNNKKSIFTLPYKKDGWYQFYLILVPVTYANPSSGDIRYNPDEGQLEKFTTEWEEIEDSDLNTLVEGDYVYGFAEEIFQLNLIKQKNCLMEKYTECIQCSTCDCKKHFEQLSKIKVQIQAIDYTFYSNKKYEAVKLLDRSNKEFNCCK